MKRNLYFFVVGILLIINSSAQGVTTDSTAILDSLRSAGIRVQIKYVPKPEPIPNEFFSVQLGAFLSEISTSRFEKAESIYHIINEEEIYIYLSGEFKELNNAILEKNKLKRKGEQNIYVVKVIDKRKVVIIE